MDQFLRKCDGEGAFRIVGNGLVTDNQLHGGWLTPGNTSNRKLAFSCPVSALNRACERKRPLDLGPFRVFSSPALTFPFPGTSHAQSMIKSGRACITYLRSDCHRYRSSALVVDVMGSMGRAHKPPRILRTARFCRSTPSHSVGTKET